MKRGTRILISVLCVVVLLVAWLVVVKAPSDEEKQLALMESASALMADKIYIRAQPLLEEAIGYNTEHTLEAETMLKEIYLRFIGQSGYYKKYTDLLGKQLAREDATPELFTEAAQFYLNASKLDTALEVMRQGIAKTNSDSLRELYEDNRYGYKLSRVRYDDVTAIHGTTITVQLNDLWGLASSNGALMLPCEYEKISNFDSGLSVVKKDGEIYSVNGSNQRMYLLKSAVTDFGGHSGNRLSLRFDDGWHLADGTFASNATPFEEILTFSEGYVAVKENGHWGVMNMNMEWLLNAEYDRIITDELGKAYGQGAVFAEKDGKIGLYVNGQQVGGTYEDAKPFGAWGYAAVKQGGKWGFIDPNGTVVIDFQFDDALSFGQHLAAVKQGDTWGYISLRGEMVIEPVFLQAKSFSNNSAPVLTERGWQFITLLES